MAMDDIHNVGPAIGIGPALLDDEMCDVSVRLLSKKSTWSDYAQDIRATYTVWNTHNNCTNNVSNKLTSRTYLEPTQLIFITFIMLTLHTFCFIASSSLS